MASIMCSNCGAGIRYHDEPNGIEFTAFALEEWKRLVETDMVLIYYDLEGTDDYLTMWRCPECGTMHVFAKHDNNVIKVFAPSEEDVFCRNEGKEYVVFDDYNYYEITEPDITGKEYLQNYSPETRFYCLLQKDKMAFFKTEDLDKPFRFFKEIPLAKEEE